MDGKLDLILEGMKELQQITRAIHNRQEASDAKLEALMMEVNQIQGNIKKVEEGQEMLLSHLKEV